MFSGERNNKTKRQREKQYDTNKEKEVFSKTVNRFFISWALQKCVTRSRSSHSENQMDQIVNRLIKICVFSGVFLQRLGLVLHFSNQILSRLKCHS